MALLWGARSMFCLSLGLLCHMSKAQLTQPSSRAPGQLVSPWTDMGRLRFYSHATSSPCEANQSPVDHRTREPAFSATCSRTTRVTSRMSLTALSGSPTHLTLWSFTSLVESLKCQEARRPKYPCHFSPRWCGASCEQRRPPVPVSAKGVRR